MVKIQAINSHTSLNSCRVKPQVVVSENGYQINKKNNQIVHKYDGKNKQERRYLAWQIAPDLFSSFKFAGEGVIYAFTTQRNFRIHTFMTVIAFSLGIYLQATTVEMALVTLTCAMVMILELINTALESVVDLTVGKHYHELAKTAKDCAAGAVLISAIASLSVAGFILLPHAIVLIF